MSAETILVTGGTGFLGAALTERLSTQMELAVVLPVRDHRFQPASPSVRVVQIDGLDADTHWGHALSGVDKVVHAAARVHVMKESSSDPLAEFRKVNVDGTLNLARQAAAAGVKRFIFISSIKVNGEFTEPGKPFCADDLPAPVDSYGISKLEAEQKLRALSSTTSMEVVIIRPVLIYGPGVKANFLSMMNWIHKGVPLPFGAIHNKRSLVALDNVVDLIVTCLSHPAAADQIFLVSDGQDVSTTELLRKTGEALNQRARLIPLPVWMMKVLALSLGRRALSQRLFDSLQVDISKNRQLLDWTPPLNIDMALKKTAQYFLESRIS
ncbi:SDR family oxidoreductase [Pseudomonas sp. AD21]|uniref:UDP-glucose 4-epimerase family protein n=1 Tax=Pseudomonas sp. AD21 TaxID=396378 RepID=UPI000C85977A|nr:SDR family oxidoreductase [Pseudomonas sp. AD21]